MAKTLLIFGSLTGNTENVAYKIQEICKAKGKEIEVKNALDADASDLTGEYSSFIFASSTWDDGQLQSDFNDFIERIAESKPSLAEKKVAIFACGDSNYVNFCGSASILERVFVNEMGGKKIAEILRVNGYPETEENQTLIQGWAEKLADLID